MSVFLRIFGIIFYVILFVGCNNNSEKDKKSIRQEVNELITVDKQKLYLEEIYHLDQKARTNRQALEAEHGYMSEKVAVAVKKIMESDKINLLKVNQYLKTYGHPSIAEHGKKASMAPWIVIHHTASIEVKENYFNYLYQAYKNKDLKPGSFSMYLNRWHTEKFGERLSLPNPYREEEMIIALIDKLELQINF